MTDKHQPSGDDPGSEPPTEWFQSLTDHAPVGIAFAEPSGNLVYANQRWRDLAGFTGALPASAEVMLSLVHPDDRKTVVEVFRRSADGDGESREKLRVNLDGDEIRYVTLAVRPIVDGPSIAGYAVGLTDVTELVAIADEVRRSEVRFKSVAKALPIGVFRTDRNGNVIWSNPRMDELWGKRPPPRGNLQLDTSSPRATSPTTPSQTRTVFDFVHPDDAAEVYERVQEALRRREPYEATHRFIDANGDIRWVISRATSILDDTGRIVEHVGSLEDITEIHVRSAGFAHQAAHDPLTQLPNRNTLEDLVNTLAAETPGRTDLGIVFIDLDGFKAVNDTWGHQAGDAVLVEVGRRLSTVIRQGDTVGRYGGDEFLMVCPGIDDPEVLARISERVSEAISTSPIPFDGHDHEIGASVGTALGPGTDTVADLLHRADEAMYEAKRIRQS